MLQFSEFVWPLSYLVWDVFNNLLLIDATDRSKISSDQKRFFIALSLYPLSFFANTPFKLCLFKTIRYQRLEFKKLIIIKWWFTFLNKCDLPTSTAGKHVRTISKLNTTISSTILIRYMFKGTIVDLVLLSLHVGSLEIMLTSPIKENKNVR